MDKYELHLQFLIEALPMLGEQTCRQVFLEDAKRDVRKALFFLLQPKVELEKLITNFELLTAEQAEEQLAILSQIFHCFCPNDSYLHLVTELEKGKPFRIDSETLPKLKAFRRAPRKEFLQQLFRLVATAEEKVLVFLLEELQPFGRELEPLWATIDAYANYDEKEIARAALNLLAQMPSGVQKSIITFSKHCANPARRFYALSAMQLVTGLSRGLLISLFNPIIAEYRRLAMTQGAMNDLWEEFRLIQNIARNNGVNLSIPDISLGRF